VDDVRAMIAGSGGPRSNGVTQTATVRLHDDKSTYTGAGAVLVPVFQGSAGR